MFCTSFFTILKKVRFALLPMLCMLILQAGGCSSEQTGSVNNQQGQIVNRQTSGDSSTQGGGGSSASSGATSSYRGFSSSDNANSDLVGTALRTNNQNSSVEITTASGTLQHNTKATTLNDSTYTLVDNDGFDGTGRLTDGTSTLISDGNQGFSGTYEYVRPYTQTYPNDSVRYDKTGVYGIPIATNDMPTSATASYMGEAIATVTQAASGFSLSGKTQVTANFGSANAEITINQITAIDQSTGQATNTPIDRIRLSTRITGNRITGNSVSTTLNGSSVDLTGVNTQSQTSGHFYGYDSANRIPDEVGGVFKSTGNIGQLQGVFVAD